MDKSREQFLEWFSKEYEEVNNSTELSAQVIKMIASAAWQASRAAVEVEIPEVEKWRSPEAVRAQRAMLVLVKQAISDAGLKVKGE
ncbi:hypothetical protein SNN58_001240 [Cronobacter dublinensis]|nr:hypothetical protein [Cronobacter dublinensis]ELY3972328.1 hypothetical protein [Cronobacter dublinensis]ELY4483538.1 hypothetical protein [Cronobacter dublinensis]ELY5822758.1 hypothetical protein [Cronobacter dublinensis]